MFHLFMMSLPISSNKSFRAIHFVPYIKLNSLTSYTFIRDSKQGKKNCQVDNIMAHAGKSLNCRQSPHHYMPPYHSFLFMFFPGENPD